MVTVLLAASSCFQGVNADSLLGFRQGFVCACNDSMKCSILLNLNFFFSVGNAIFLFYSWEGPRWQRGLGSGHDSLQKVSSCTICSGVKLLLVH